MFLCYFLYSIGFNGCKIARKESEGYNVMKDGTFLVKTIYTVADKTSFAELTVWGEQCVDINKWYSMRNISVEQYNKKQCLSTTKDTEITAISPQGTVFFVPTSTSITDNCEIIGGQIKNTYICPLKHVIDNMSLSSTKILCPKCKTQFKSTAIGIKTCGNLTIKSSSGKILRADMGNSIIETLVDVKPILCECFAFNILHVKNVFEK